MAKITVEEQKEFTLLPPDSILHLKVDELDIKNVEGRHGPWQKLEFKFKILGVQVVGGGGDPAEYEDLIASPIWGSVPFKLTDSPENKLRLWAEAILGFELGVGFELDTDLFLNRECRGLTSQYEKRAKDPKTGQPFKGHQIDSLLPKAGGAPAQSNPWAQQQAVHQQQLPQDPWSTPATAPAQQDPWAVPGQSQQQAAWDEPPF